MSGKWQPVLAEWRTNRRLRLGALVVLAIMGVQLVLHLSEARGARVEQYERNARLLARLEEASKESAWPARARAAAAALEQAKATLPTARSEGLAQAELQAWLSDLATFAGVGNPTVRVETALAVDGHPGLWQVLGRLEGDLAESQVPMLMGTLASALPWYQTEQLQVQGGAVPRVSLVMRGYFLKMEGKQVASVRPANLPTPDPAAAVAPVLPVRRNPLAPAGPVAAAAPAAAPGAAPAAGQSPQAPAQNRMSPVAAPPGAVASPAGGVAPPARRNPLAPPDARPRRSDEEGDQPRKGFQRPRPAGKGQ